MNSIQYRGHTIEQQPDESWRIKGWNYSYPMAPTEIWYPSLDSAKAAINTYCTAKAVAVTLGVCVTITTGGAGIVVFVPWLAKKIWQRF